MRRLTVLFAAMVAAIVLASGMAMSQTSPPVSYTVKNLGTLCGDSCSFPSSLAFAINDFGVVVGQASPPHRWCARLSVLGRSDAEPWHAAR